MKKQAMGLILTMIVASNITLDYKKDVAVPNSRTQADVNWSESIGSSNVQEFNDPRYKGVYNIINFFKKKNLDIGSKDGRLILFYKVKV